MKILRVCGQFRGRELGAALHGHECINRYAIHPRQIVDAPDWALHDRYDIEGTSDTPGEPSLAQQREMLQKLLADRFGLKFHGEKRELPVYAIQLAKGGPRLKAAAKPYKQPDQESSVHGTQEIVTYTSASMNDFVLGTQFLQLFLDRPLIDQTELTGKYDFAIHYTWDESESSTDPNAPSGLFTAIQEQLGLKLVPSKAPVDVFIIDHLEQPSPN